MAVTVEVRTPDTHTPNVPIRTAVARITAAQPFSSAVAMRNPLRGVFRIVGRAAVSSRSRDRVILGKASSLQARGQLWASIGIRGPVGCRSLCSPQVGSPFRCPNVWVVPGFPDLESVRQSDDRAPDRNRRNCPFCHFDFFVEHWKQKRASRVLGSEKALTCGVVNVRVRGTCVAYLAMHF